MTDNSLLLGKTAAEWQVSPQLRAFVDLCGTELIHWVWCSSSNPRWPALTRFRCVSTALNTPSVSEPALLQHASLHVIYLLNCSVQATARRCRSRTRSGPARCCCAGATASPKGAIDLSLHLAPSSRKPNLCFNVLCSQRESPGFRVERRQQRAHPAGPGVPRRLRPRRHSVG